MIPFPLQIIIAVLLDALFGDPRWFPHPVRLIGFLARCIESGSRRLFPAKTAGILTVLGVLGLTGYLLHFLLYLGLRFHPLLHDALSIFFIYTSLAARDLAGHSTAVYQALKKDGLIAARRKVGMIVGRDPENLDGQGIARAAVESVAESMVDGVTAPLFFAALAGPFGALLYRAVNTMDSMFGYRNERYREFGWAAARLDDAANFIPARLTGMLVPVAALAPGYDSKNSWKIFRRDRLKHGSPNSGHPEAAVAGALGIRLGGPAVYFKTMVEKPFIGDALKPIEPEHILQTNRLMFLTAFLFLLTVLPLSFLILFLP